MSLRERWDLKLMMAMMKGVRLAKVMGVVAEEGVKEEAGSALAGVVMEVEGRVEQGKFGVPCRHMQTTFGH